MDNTQNKTWHYLDSGTIMMKEQASALAKVVDLVAWAPTMEWLGAFHDWQRVQVMPDPYLKIERFPLQRGFAKFPVRWIAPYQGKLLKRMLAMMPKPEESPLICTTAFYAALAELWPGPVIYYKTDLEAAYPSLDPRLVRSLATRMCRVARAVCPNSKRTANYLLTQANCDPAKITIIPGATREANVPASPRFEPAELPADARDLPRPIAGVLGDLSGNMDWELLVDAIERTPQFTWLFVGPTHTPIVDRGLREAREKVKTMARFVGMKPYGELQAYARGIDVAVLPYKKREPTYSGSSTRFWEHLAAGRPMISTRGFAELLEKEPLLKLVDTPDEMAAALEHIRSLNFRDGHETERWEASQQATWEVRSRAIMATIEPQPKAETRPAPVAMSSI
jgi:glycosyltransferase involved in cell wall biosynthesis